MKVSVFIDGQNFYRSLQRVDEALRVDYDRLAAWIIQAVGGPTAIFAGAYYYVGVSADAPPLVAGFLKGLELRPGYFVRRELRVKRTARCSLCGGETEYTTEKRVDTRLVADLIHYAAIGAFDTAVLVSGDDDFVPAVEAVNALGRQVWVATWSAGELSSDLRVRCFGHLQLADGIAAFRSERPARTVERVPPRPAPSRLAHAMRESSGPLPQSALERGLEELRRAEARLPHVGRGYFVMRWKSHALPPAGPEREALVQQLVDAGLAEEFPVTDADGRTITALRSREVDGDLALPG